MLLQLQHVCIFIYENKVYISEWEEEEEEEEEKEKGEDNENDNDVILRINWCVCLRLYKMKPLNKIIVMNKNLWKLDT